MGLIYANGVHQNDLATLISAIVTNYNGVLAKLDSDATVSGTNYVSGRAATVPGVTYETANGRLGNSQAGFYAFASNFVTQFNACLTQLDADAGVADTNYNALWALSLGGIVPSGMSQGMRVKFLDNAIAALDGLNAKLDADGTVTDTNYASLWNVTDTVDSNGASLTQ